MVTIRPDSSDSGFVQPPQDGTGPTVVETGQLSQAAKASVYVVAGASALAIALPLAQLVSGPGPSQWVILAALQSLGVSGFASVLALLALLVLLYSSSKTDVAQVESAHRHLAELNELYLSTVETLATAIDVKDQVTSGHIRRVQQSTLRLARTLGVNDSKQIKALECASLLHDLGKLVVPEHILNKPGPLNWAEFEQMKQHASMGANILSKVRFPYPVEPIVRHHHENWDGSGYPDGLSGEAIPLGARILAVVDCFDALRSDRPYRRRLSAEEALDIVRSRRGSMYDPEVVDEFVKIHAQLELGETGDGKPGPLREFLAPQTPGLSNPQTVATDTGAVGFPEWLEAVAPDALAILYRYVPQRNALTATCISQRKFDSLTGLEISVGDGISGWVGANRQSIVNADPRLDFGDRAEETSCLSSCLSVAIADDSELLGVLSLYATSPDAFNREQVNVIESMAQLVAAGFRRDSTTARISSADPSTLSTDRGTKELAERNMELAELNQQLKAASYTDALTGLFNRRFLSEQIEKEVALVHRAHTGGDHPAPGDPSRELLLLMLDVDGLKGVNDRYGHAAGDRALLQVREILMRVCRTSDMLVRWGGDEFLLVGRQSDHVMGERLAERLRIAIAEHEFDLGAGNTTRMSCSIGFAMYPFVSSTPNLLNWEQVVHMADRGLYEAKGSGRNRYVGVFAAPHLDPQALVTRMDDDLEQLADEGILTLRAGPQTAAAPEATEAQIGELVLAEAV